MASFSLFSSVAVGIMASLVADARAFDMAPHRISRTMAAAYTPMKDNGLELNLEIIPAYAAHLARLNVTNVMPCGTNGESVSLSVSERIAVVEAWARVATQHNLKVYVHVGSDSLVDAIALAKHAATTAGIYGVLCMSPVFFKPSLQTLHDYLAVVASAAAELPFWFYHIPEKTGVLSGQAHALLDLADRSGKIPNLMGMKFTDDNLQDFQLCTAVGAPGKYNMLFGHDSVVISAFSVGAAAAVSSTVQFSPTLREAILLHDTGNLAGAYAKQAENAQLCSYFGALQSQAKDVQKSIMKMVGIDVGPPRLPNVDLTSTEFHQLKSLLTRDGLIDAVAGVGTRNPAVMEFVA